MFIGEVIAAKARFIFEFFHSYSSVTAVCEIACMLDKIILKNRHNCQVKIEFSLGNLLI